VNYQEQNTLRNISKQYSESLTQGRQNYHEYLRSVRLRQPYMNTVRTNQSIDRDNSGILAVEKVQIKQAA